MVTPSLLKLGAAGCPVVHNTTSAHCSVKMMPFPTKRGSAVGQALNEDRQAMSTVEMSNAVVSIRECGSCGNYLQRIFTGKLHPDPGSVAQTCLRSCAKKKQMLNLPSYIFDKCFIRLVVVSAQLLRHICCQGGRQIKIHLQIQDLCFCSSAT